MTISISTTRMASENYGFMAPIKAALDSSLAFLAKSFSRFSRVRFNAVAPGLLKTSASAGIPGLRRFLPLRRAGDAAQAGRADRGSRQRGRVPAQPALQRHQRPADRRRRRHVDQLLRPRHCSPQRRQIASALNWSRKELGNDWRRKHFAVKNQLDLIISLVNAFPAKHASSPRTRRLGTNLDLLVDKVDDPVTRNLCTGVNSRLVTTIRLQSCVGHFNYEPYVLGSRMSRKSLSGIAGATTRSGSGWLSVVTKHFESCIANLRATSAITTVE